MNIKYKELQFHPLICLFAYIKIEQHLPQFSLTQDIGPLAESFAFVWPLQKPNLSLCAEFLAIQAKSCSTSSTVSEPTYWHAHVVSFMYSYTHIVTNVCKIYCYKNKVPMSAIPQLKRNKTF